MALYTILNNDGTKFLIRNLFIQPADFIYSQIRLGYYIITKWYYSKTSEFIREIMLYLPI